ncbi:hypothetical protein [Streptomyces sp. NPDC055794]
MDFSRLVERALEASRSALRAVTQAGAAVRRSFTRADIWVQDHHMVLLIGVLAVLAPSVALVMWGHWDAVVEAARELAPVMTVIGVTGGAVAGTVKWVRKRRASRLAAAPGAVPDVPAPRYAAAQRSGADDTAPGPVPVDDVA